MTVQLARTPTSGPLADVYVLHGRPLRPGVELTQTARFGDDEWPIGPAALQTQQRSLTLRFDTATKQYRHVLKQFTYAALSGPLPPNEARLTISSVLKTGRDHHSVYFAWLGAMAWGKNGQL